MDVPRNVRISLGRSKLIWRTYPGASLNWGLFFSPRKEFRVLIRLFGLLIFDEIIGACNTGVFDQAALVEFLKNKPQELEVVMTGRNPAPELVELADYVSEVCMRKHPFKRGIPARVGIEK